MLGLAHSNITVLRIVGPGALLQLTSIPNVVLYDDVLHLSGVSDNVSAWGEADLMNAGRAGRTAAAARGRRGPLTALVKLLSASRMQHSRGGGRKLLRRARKPNVAHPACVADVKFTARDAAGGAVEANRWNRTGVPDNSLAVHETYEFLAGLDPAGLDVLLFHATFSVSEWQNEVVQQLHVNHSAISVVMELPEDMEVFRDGCFLQASVVSVEVVEGVASCMMCGGTPADGEPCGGDCMRLPDVPLPISAPGHRVKIVIEGQDGERTFDVNEKTYTRCGDARARRVYIGAHLALDYSALHGAALSRASIP